ncbi:cadherin EGF LAG seven-pass G-type receptor 1-like [Gorilla gorilla gorilla]|uniref:cadherin EGF LAG seven-pass G-type receptor 1-like n=1 Tax=Gorilla gorilla gorilla TaxID=9595 RepID=UPI0030094D9C
MNELSRRAKPFRADVPRFHEPGLRRLSTERCLSDQNIIHLGSALLAPATRAAWEQIQWSEGGLAQLLRRLEVYFSNMARNVQWTYVQPFVIVTANMVLAVDIFDKFNFTGARVAWFDAIHEEFPRELESSISFPANFFKPPEEKGRTA